MTAAARHVGRALGRAPRPEALLRTAALAALAGGLALAGAHALLGVDPAHAAAWLPPCPFHVATGLACPGCGITRALLALAALEPGAALRLHPFAPAVPPLAAALALRPRLLDAVPRPLAAAGLAALLALWAARGLA